MASLARQLPTEWELIRSNVVADRRLKGPSDLAAELRDEGRSSTAEIARVLRERYPGLSARKAIRLVRGWTQEEAAAEWARRFGEPKAAKQFSYWENWPHSGHPPSLDKLDRLAQLYECSSADLLADLPDYGQRNQAPGTDDPTDRDAAPGRSLLAIPNEGSLHPPALVSDFAAHTAEVVDGVEIAPGEFVERTVVDAPTPGHVGGTDVEIVRSVTRSLAGSENTLGGEVVAQAGLGQLRWGARLLGASASPGVRQRLFEAVGNLAGVVGFSAFDAGEFTAATRCFRFALSCADDGESWPLRACTLADIARVHAEVGDIDAALSAIEFAEVRMDRLPDTARAMLCVMHARYLALAGRHRDALREVDAADDWLVGRDSSGDPPWLCYYDQAEHDGSVGRALMPVAVAAGRPGLSRSRLESAVRLQGTEYPRSRVFSRVRLARLLMASGDPDEAAGIGSEALADARALRSRRVTEELGGLLHTLEQRVVVPTVFGLRQEIRAHLTEAQDATPPTSRRE